MAQILGTNVSSGLRPNDSADTYDTHSAEYGRGGWRYVSTLANRDEITAQRRQAGMAVYVHENDTEYLLNDDLVNWTIKPIGVITAHNNLTGRDTAHAHPGTAIDIDPTGFTGPATGVTDVQELAAAVDGISITGGGSTILIPEYADVHHQHPITSYEQVRNVDDIIINIHSRVFDRVFRGEDGPGGMPQTPAQSQTRLVCIGDSNTNRPAQAIDYCRISQLALSRYNYYIVNQGFPGSTASDAIDDFYRDVTLRYVRGARNIVSFCFGFNDMNGSFETTLVDGSKYQIVTQGTLDFTTYGAANNTPGTEFVATDNASLGYGDSVFKIFYTVNEFYANIETLVDDAQAIGYECIVMLYPPTTKAVTGEHISNRITTANEKIVSENSLRGEQFTIIDLNSLLSSNGVTWDNPTWVSGSDGTHWLNEAHNAVATSLVDVINPLSSLDATQYNLDGIMLISRNTTDVNSIDGYYYTCLMRAYSATPVLTTPGHSFTTIVDGVNTRPQISIENVLKTNTNGETFTYSWRAAKNFCNIINDDVTLTTVIGAESTNQLKADGISITTAIGGQFQGAILSTSTNSNVTNVFGVRILNPTLSATSTTTNCVGLYFDEMAAGTSTNYEIEVKDAGYLRIHGGISADGFKTGLDDPAEFPYGIHTNESVDAAGFKSGDADPAEFPYGIHTNENVDIGSLSILGVPFSPVREFLSVSTSRTIGNLSSGDKNGLTYICDQYDGLTLSFALDTEVGQYRTIVNVGYYGNVTINQVYDVTWGYYIEGRNGVFPYRTSIVLLPGQSVTLLKIADHVSYFKIMDMGVHSIADHSGTAAMLVGDAPTNHSHSTNKLNQSYTHESADTDASSSALHHTLGTGSNQAAEGDHTHSSFSKTLSAGTSSVSEATINAATTVTLSADSSSIFWGSYTIISKTDAYNSTSARRLRATDAFVKNTGTGTIAGIAVSISGIQQGDNTNAAGTITDAYNHYSTCIANVNSTITNRYGYYVVNKTGTGTLTNQYGVYVENMTGGATLNYAIKTKGGVIGFEGLPSSSSGLSTGDLYTQTATQLGGSGTTKVLCVV